MKTCGFSEERNDWDWNVECLQPKINLTLLKIPSITNHAFKSSNSNIFFSFKLCFSSLTFRNLSPLLLFSSSLLWLSNFLAFLFLPHSSLSSFSLFFLTHLYLLSHSSLSSLHTFSSRTPSFQPSCSCWIKQGWITQQEQIQSKL